ncbi:DsbE family thiol:disulfide interchange protein [Vibrio sp. T187]|uniref:DsbE family thiol:disulfide interchange protein n=1 Tax=Vibrio TaxID=662 RepID=UPI0010C97600|nr:MULTISPECIES: DsbE family thiol:disulfide interchange protein [Vibrio]MBW3694801.1 DsbE family thiol:disulfide interchange protein [Vibrio sp. T187]
MRPKTRNTLVALFAAALLVVAGTMIAMQNKQRSTQVQLVEREFPAFVADDLFDKDLKIERRDITDHKYQLVNVWASWCGICREEHEYLNKLKNKGIPINGINYRDSRSEAIALLEADGNPYNKIIYDQKGDLSLDIGVVGTPETYLLDHNGKVIVKISGILDSQVWERNLAKYFEGI